MIGRASLATARRVAQQLRHDPRTVVLMLLMPSLLLALLRYVFASERAFAASAPALLGVFPLTLMFLVTSITTLRERTSGTLERLMTTPIAKLDLLVGYAIAFGLVALVQVVAAVLTSVALGLDVGGSIGWLLLVAAADALLGVALGLLASAFARTEFQAIQFMPVVVLPQLLLCGLFHPRDGMARLLEWASDVMPLSYAVEALQRVAYDDAVGVTYTRDLLLVLACAVVGLALAAATLRRQTP
ncbi:MAG: ABC transporter permease [Nocardioidaceae bacterium]